MATKWCYTSCQNRVAVEPWSELHRWSGRPWCEWGLAKAWSELAKALSLQTESPSQTLAVKIPKEWNAIWPNLKRGSAKQNGDLLAGPQSSRRHQTQGRWYSEILIYQELGFKLKDQSDHCKPQWELQEESASVVSLTAATFYFYKSFWGRPGSAPKPPGTSSHTFSGTLSATLLNLTWLCTKASQTFSGTFSEHCWTRPGFAPRLPGTFNGKFFGTLLNLTWLCTKASQTLSGTFSGTFSGTLLNLTWSAPKPPRPSPELSPEPSLEPCWTWLGFAPRLPGTFSRTFSGTLLNLVEPDPAPAPVHAGAILGSRPH